MNIFFDNDQKASRALNRMKLTKKFKQVKSGIAFDQLDVNIAPQQHAKISLSASFVQSRLARVMLAGAGFLADAYDLFVINLVLRLLRDEYPAYKASGKLSELEGAVASAALFGSVLGQLVAGSMADIIGRKKIFIATAILITLGCFGSACSIDTPTLTVYGQIACWRFFLGAGVGGEYPLAATVTSESSSAARRGALMSSVFAMQGVGALMSVLVVIICLSLNCSSGFTWRFSLAFGAVPVMVAFPWRLRMHETETFERVQQNRRDIKEFQSSANISYGGSTSSSNNASSNHNNASSNNYDVGEGKYLSITSNPQTPMSAYNSMRRMLGFSTTSAAQIDENTALLNNNMSGSSSGSGGNSHGVKSEDTISFSRWAEVQRAWMFYKWHIFGTAVSWFLLDVVFYANGLFNHDVTSIILSAGKPTTSLQDSINSMLLCLMAIPGYWLSVYYMDRVGRKNIQFNGFVIMAVLFGTCATFRDWFLEANAPPYRKWCFLLLYSLTFLFSNFGPNTTTFVIPGEIYPPEVKATCHGFSAASGKLGAAAGAYLFPMVLNRMGTSPENHSLGLQVCFYLCAGIAVLGAVVTHYFIPTYNARDLEDPDAYLSLDHECIQPSDETFVHMRQTQQAKQAPYTMIEVIDSADNYGLQAKDSTKL